jgi:hypothetical protein
MNELKNNHPLMSDGYWLINGSSYRIKTYPKDSSYSPNQTVLGHWEWHKNSRRHRYVNKAFVDREQRKVKLWKRILTQISVGVGPRSGYRNQAFMIEDMKRFAADPTIGKELTIGALVQLRLRNASSPNFGIVTKLNSKSVKIHWTSIPATSSLSPTFVPFNSMKVLASGKIEEQQ